MNSKMYVYAVYPIDHGWEYLKTVRETLIEMSKHMVDNFDEDSSNSYIDYFNPKQFLDAYETAKKLARKEGWEGDFRHEPYVFWIPGIQSGDDGFEYGFVFKQENNGDTFVISPQPLNWITDNPYP